MRAFSFLLGAFLYTAALVPAVACMYVLLVTGLWKSHVALPSAEVWNAAYFNLKLSLRLVVAGRGPGDIDLEALYFSGGLTLLWPIVFLVSTAVLFAPSLWRYLGNTAPKARIFPGLLVSAIFLGLWVGVFREISLSEEERFTLAVLTCFPAFFVVYLFTRGVEHDLFGKVLHFSLLATFRCLLLSVGSLLGLILLVWILGYLATAPVLALMSHIPMDSVQDQIRALPFGLSRLVAVAMEHQLPVIWALAVDAFLLVQFLVVPALSYGLTYRQLHGDG